ncbi:acyltransferase, partial [bacterium]|nr:acyltransferase [bacterium]
MKVGFIQFKVDFGHKEENLQKITAFILKSDADLLVLPELFNSGYLFPSRHTLKMLAEPIPNGRTTQTLIQLARDHQVFLVGGLPEVAGDQFFNSAVLVGPEGYIGHYRKIHLFDT